MSCNVQRITGDALMLTVGGVDYWAECTSVQIAPSSTVAVTEFGQTAALSVPTAWSMEVVAVQSTAPGSLWRLMFEQASPGWATYVYAPFGDKPASDRQPHFTGSAKIPDVSSLGGQAGSDYTFTVTLPLDGKPSLVTV